MRYQDLPADVEKALEPEYGAALRALKSQGAGAALRHADAAWAILPEPKLQWSMSYLTATLLIKARRAAGFHAEAASLAGWCAETTEADSEKPVYYFHAGAALYDAGSEDSAYHAFERSWQAAGAFAFKAEHRRYWEFFERKREDRHAQS